MKTLLILATLSFSLSSFAESESEACAKISSSAAKLYEEGQKLSSDIKKMQIHAKDTLNEISIRKNNSANSTASEKTISHQLELLNLQVMVLDASKNDLEKIVLKLNDLNDQYDSRCRQ